MIKLNYPLSAMALVFLFSGCGVLVNSEHEQPTFYALDATQDEVANLQEPEISISYRPTLIVNPSHAAAGYDSPRILYVRKPHQLEYYAHSEWIDTPARMLTPLIVAALARRGGFQAVVLTPSLALGELRLDTEIVRLVHEYSEQSSRVRFTLRAYIVDSKHREVLGGREFDEVVDVQSAGPYGVVVASNQAVQTALGKLTIFANEEAENWRSKQP
jgi:cholesterol transport system auxiliary component